jgi:MFS family permease
MDVAAKERPRAGLRSLPRNVWAVSATSFLTDVSSEMVLNLLPLFLANVLGAKTSVIGLIEGIAETTASLLKIFSGWLSDLLGQRKWITVAGYGLSAVAKPFLYFATTWPGVLLVRFADRVGKGIRTAPRDALIADSVGEDQRGIAFGVHRAGDTAGAFLGILIALLVVWMAQTGSARLERAAFQRVVLVSVVPAVLGVLVLALGAQEARAAGPARAERPALSLAGLDRRFKAFLAIVVLFTLGNSSDAFLILRAQERGLSVLQVLGMLLTFNAIYTLVSGPAGALSDRVGRRRLMVAGVRAHLPGLRPGPQRVAGLGPLRPVRPLLRHGGGGGQGPGGGPGARGEAGHGLRRLQRGCGAHCLPGEPHRWDPVAGGGALAGVRRASPLPLRLGPGPPLGGAPGGLVPAGAARRPAGYGRATVNSGPGTAASPFLPAYEE